MVTSFGISHYSDTESRVVLPRPRSLDRQFERKECAMSYNPLIISRQVLKLVLLILPLLVVATISAQDDDVEAKIENAMSAAPAAIAEEATILDHDGTVLREGTNEWTCFPDLPVSPGNDPACYDPTWMLLNNAWGSEELPEITVPGIAYMLQGGSDASNMDPLQPEPLDGEDWISTPPHIMVLPITGTDMSSMPTDHMYGGPYVMWMGTPYQHIMVPVSLEELSH
jgi:hypothetical protein